jgi:hypothetical protein
MKSVDPRSRIQVAQYGMLKHKHQDYIDMADLDRQAVRGCGAAARTSGCTSSCRFLCRLLLHALAEPKQSLRDGNCGVITGALQRSRPTILRHGRVHLNARHWVFAPGMRALLEGGSVRIPLIL